ncbi:MAG: Mrp/NBP35 family ATP-binding protein [Betaproteobacteria bacterium AqS2]|uniref:Iron-sulfur cluster carrier protein n=1 Tax=Candidatus Amphirhobacter heronislandensis TaxID=1732024 RepID=A0A930XXC2_9GAMM|nr:Mrp/NBP35 family ATP-binding protein [Betaproteobacteria bacterium AqS2]
MAEDRDGAIEAALAEIPAEHLDADLVAAKVARVEDGRITLRYPYPGQSAGQRAVAQIRERLRDTGHEASVEVVTKIEPRLCPGGAERLPGVANVVAVASAKGGVGKSTVAANLALGLQAEGARAGLLDADVHGPSVAAAFGGGTPQVNDAEQLEPLRLGGLQAISMGHLIEGDQPMVWRGPMVAKALRQFLRETAWRDLDFLVVDLPPGTGDVPLSLAQNAPLAGAVIVTTPQELAIADARRGVKMFEKVSVPVLGYVANMIHFICPGCGAKHEVFGPGAAGQFGRELKLSSLAELPLDSRIGTSAEPVLLANPEAPVSAAFRELAVRVGVELLKRPVDRGAKLPPIKPA